MGQVAQMQVAQSARWVALDHEIESDEVAALLQEVSMKWRIIDRMNIASDDHPLPVVRECQTWVVRWKQAVLVHAESARSSGLSKLS